MSGTPLYEWLDNRGIDRRLYTAWQNMKRRCRPTYKQRKDYFDQGITVCQKWLNSFQAFAKDVGPHPGDGWTLDRKNNSRGYSPRNVRWATRTTQQQNQRRSVGAKIILEVRRRRDRGDRTCDIIRDLGLSQRNTYDIVNNQTWKNVVSRRG